jgi:hypothetical protein
LTLIEVLAAIFIMGVGLLAILTLFPLGALSMARAVREDRAANAGANASSLAVAMDLRNDPNVAGNLGATPPGVPGPPPITFLPPDPNGPGYPLMVDPFYCAISAPFLGGYIIPGYATPGLPRVPPSYTGTSLPLINRYFSFPDEIDFDRNGAPSNSVESSSPGSVVGRPGTYNWAYVLRRPRSSTPELVQLQVIVYAGRNVQEVSGEQVFDNANMGTQGSSSLTINYPAINATNYDVPTVRKGSWVLDTTYTPNATNTYATVNGYFYRVAGVNDIGGNTLKIDLETPLQANVRSLVLLENVITVLDRGTAWRP